MTDDVTEPGAVVPALPDTTPAAAVIPLLAAAMPVVLDIDWAGSIRHASPTATTMFGAPVEGRSLYDWFAPSDQAAVHELLLSAYDAPDDRLGWQTLACGRRADGLPLVVRVSIAERAASSPDGPRVVVERWGGEVVAADQPAPSTPPRTGPDHLLSHDARGAVRNTKNFVGIFSRKLRVDDGAPIPGADGEPLSLDILETGLRAVGNADEMLERIVWFIRLENDPLVVEPLLLGDLIEQARETATERLLELASTTTHTDLEGPLDVRFDDPIAAAASVLGNEDLLVWAVGELLVNARKFGGPTTAITVVSRTDDDQAWCHVKITNTGKQIDPSLAEDAFKLGRMLQPRGDRPGVGMGLPLARRILTRHGGRLSARPGPTDSASEPSTALSMRLPTATHAGHAS